MGAPCDPQSPTTDELLRALIRDPAVKVSESIAHQLGLDLEVAEATFQTEVKPKLDALSGYRRLTEMKPDIRGQLEDWHQRVQRAGLAHYGQVQLIVRARLGGNHWGDTGEEKPGNKALAVFLTREGTWLLWHGVHGPYLGILDQKLTEYPELASVCAAIDELAGNLRFTDTGKSDPPKFASLLIERGLRLLLERMLGELERRVKDTRTRLERADQRAARIHVGR